MLARAQSHSLPSTQHNQSILTMASSKESTGRKEADDWTMVRVSEVGKAEALVNFHVQ